MKPLTETLMADLHGDAYALMSDALEYYEAHHGVFHVDSTCDGELLDGTNPCVECQQGAIVFVGVARAFALSSLDREYTVLIDRWEGNLGMRDDAWALVSVLGAEYEGVTIVRLAGAHGVHVERGTASARVVVTSNRTADGVRYRWAVVRGIDVPSHEVRTVDQLATELRKDVFA